VPLHIRREHLVLESTDGLLEGLALALKVSVLVNFGAEGTITELPDGLIHAIIPHVISVKESKDIGGDERGRHVDVNYRRSMDLAVVSGPVERQLPFYKRVRGVEVGADVTRRRFAAVFISDME
jgi:hypothetical protein